ncbi:hypothetical protein Scep_005377 [Stephania cephalantha]|uniref:Uncharacterized protein n=1 Tax=Stephania cephalantha TaxID=152367 RepID=A0AAP0KU62_9MAGN
MVLQRPNQRGDGFRAQTTKSGDNKRALPTPMAMVSEAATKMATSGGGVQRAARQSCLHSSHLALPDSTTSPGSSSTPWVDDDDDDAEEPTRKKETRVTKSLSPPLSLMDSSLVQGIKFLLSFAFLAFATNYPLTPPPFRLRRRARRCEREAGSGGALGVSSQVGEAVLGGDSWAATSKARAKLSVDYSLVLRLSSGFVLGDFAVAREGWGFGGGAFGEEGRKRSCE